MDCKFTQVNTELYQYAVAHRSADADAVPAELREATAKLGDIAQMQTGPDQCTLLSILVACSGSRRTLEVGTFTGYSAIAIARALPADGTLLCLDASEEWTAMARHYWERAGVADKIELRLGPAIASLAALPLDAGFDFAYVDADKTGYDGYYEAILPRLRRNGLIVFDNTLCDGRVIEDNLSGSDAAVALLNDKLATDPRIESVLLAIADGMTICRKR